MPERGVAVAFERASIKGLKDGGREAQLQFALVLDKRVARLLPAPVAQLFEEIRRPDIGIGGLTVDEGVIAAHNFRFYETPEAKKPSVLLNALVPGNVELLKDRQSGQVLFRFRLVTSVGKEAWMWIYKALDMQLWMEHELAQLEMELVQK
jgi:hypothetical protein